MVPKIIHYCWFGGKKLPKAAKKCIASWKKYCPDYEIKEWDETNTDLSLSPYMKEAMENRKYAFATDVWRLIVLYNEGGIYMDVDVELIRPLDDLLDQNGFFGFETVPDGPVWIASGLGCACVPGHPIIKELLQSYDDVHFIRPDGTLNTIPCTTRNVEIFEKFGLRRDNKLQKIEGISFLPCDYLCPYNRNTGALVITENTHSIHHYAMSWGSPRGKLYFYYQRRIAKMKKNPAGRFIISMKKKILKKQVKIL